jgi:DNA repair protein RecO (recombination protein O)
LNTIHKTKGIVVKTVKYGDTSIIATIYTELFGMQSYMVKGIRKPTKKGTNNANYFYPSACLDLQVYHNEFKHLQFIKEYQWSKLYTSLHFDVVKNAVAMFCIELLQHSVKQPETNPDLFYFIEEILSILDETSDNTIIANYPLYYATKLAEYLGFSIQNNYSETYPILDLQQGFFINDFPKHNFYIENNIAFVASQVLSITFVNELTTLKLNQTIRRQLIDYLIKYFELHVTQFTPIKSLEVLREVL